MERLPMPPPIALASVSSPTDEVAPVSRRSRERLIKAGVRFHANDNISRYLEPGELEALRGEVEQRLQDLLETLVIDTASDHNTQETAQRVARMFVDEVFRGRYLPEPGITQFPNVE